MATKTGLYKSYNTEINTSYSYPNDTDTYRTSVGTMKSEEPMKTGQEQNEQKNKQKVPADRNVLGPKDCVTTCQYCQASIRTTVEYTITAKTHIAAALCSLICCCCCIPYCSKSAKNTDHYCPSCRRYLGTYEK